MAKEEYIPRTPGIKKESEKFGGWLREKPFAETTISVKKKYLALFLNYTGAEGISTRDIVYMDLLDFINHCRAKGVNIAQVNRVICTVRAYFDYLSATAPLATSNPAAGLKVRGETRKAITNTISKKHLEGFYGSYKASNATTSRNKVILGLLVYQGLALGDMERLETGHISLESKKIRVPASRHLNGRALKLEDSQLGDLQGYILHARAELLKSQHEKSGQLLVPRDGGNKLTNTLQWLFSQTRKTDPRIKNAMHIRASVISGWLKTHNLRQVQYMAGHRNVMSTEKYKTQDLEELQKALEKYHPLK